MESGDEHGPYLFRPIEASEQPQYLASFQQPRTPSLVSDQRVMRVRMASGGQTSATANPKLYNCYRTAAAADVWSSAGSRHSSRPGSSASSRSRSRPPSTSGNGLPYNRSNNNSLTDVTVARNFQQLSVSTRRAAFKTQKWSHSFDQDCMSSARSPSSSQNSPGEPGSKTGRRACPPRRMATTSGAGSRQGSFNNQSQPKSFDLDSGYLGSSVGDMNSFKSCSISDAKEELRELMNINMINDDDDNDDAVGHDGHHQQARTATVKNPVLSSTIDDLSRSASLPSFPDSLKKTRGYRDDQVKSPISDDLLADLLGPKDEQLDEEIKMILGAESNNVSYKSHTIGQEQHSVEDIIDQDVLNFLGKHCDPSWMLESEEEEQQLKIEEPRPLAKPEATKAVLDPVMTSVGQAQLQQPPRGRLVRSRTMPETLDVSLVNASSSKEQQSLHTLMDSEEVVEVKAEQEPGPLSIDGNPKDTTITTKSDMQLDTLPSFGSNLHSNNFFGDELPPSSACSVTPLNSPLEFSPNCHAAHHYQQQARFYHHEEQHQSSHDFFQFPDQPEQQQQSEYPTIVKQEFTPNQPTDLHDQCLQNPDFFNNPPNELSVSSNSNNNNNNLNLSPMAISPSLSALNTPRGSITSMRSQVSPMHTDALGAIGGCLPSISQHSVVPHPQPHQDSNHDHNNTQQLSLSFFDDEVNCSLGTFFEEACYPLSDPIYPGYPSPPRSGYASPVQEFQNHHNNPPPPPSYDEHMKSAFARVQQHQPMSESFESFCDLQGQQDDDIPLIIKKSDPASEFYPAHEGSASTPTMMGGSSGGGVSFSTDPITPSCLSDACPETPDSSVRDSENSGTMDSGSLVCKWADCGHEFESQRALVDHVTEAHVESGKKGCEERPCLWEECPRKLKPFNAKYKLSTHMRVHTKEKPYKCEFEGCTRAFARLENRKIHFRSHTGQKPFPCKYAAEFNCTKKFSNSSDRAKHEQTHKDPKPYKCEVIGCTKRYTDPSSLRKHVKSHSLDEQKQYRINKDQANNTVKQGTPSSQARWQQHQQYSDQTERKSTTTLLSVGLQSGGTLTVKLEPEGQQQQHGLVHQPSSLDDLDGDDSIPFDDVPIRCETIGTFSLAEGWPGHDDSAMEEQQQQQEQQQQHLTSL